METKLSGIQKSSVLNNEPTLSASDFDKKLLSFVKDYCSPFDDIRKCLADVRIAATVEKETKGQDLPSWPLDTCYVIQKSSVLNNEPTLSASDFDKKLLSFVKDYCSPFDDIRKCLADVRIAATVEKETKGQDLPSWPLDTCYVNQQCVIDLYNIASVGAKLAGDPSLLNDESIILDMLIEPTILGGCFAWDKVRNIVHVNNKQLDNSLLDCSCASLAKLPQWAICFNTIENNIFLDDRPVAGVIFYRNFNHKHPLELLGFASLAKLPQWAICFNTIENNIFLDDRPVAGVIFYRNFNHKHPLELLGLTPFENNALDGETAATFNLLNSILIFHDGKIVLGPHLELSNSCSVKISLENNGKGIKDFAEVMEFNKVLTNDDIIHMGNSYAKEAYGIFTLLAYLLNNLDKLKNEKGEKVSFAPNPEPVKTKQGYRLFGSDRISSYYLD